MKRTRLLGKYPPGSLCVVDGCESPPVSQRLCHAHYSRFRRNGDMESRVRPKPAIAVSDLELAVAAGLMEGEGSVRLNSVTRKNKGALIVSMANTNVEIIDWMNSRWPGHCKPVAGLRDNQKPAWRWVIASRQALAFLMKIRPFIVTERMRLRIEAAELWQQIKAKPWQHRTEADYEEAFNCWHWMSHLNRRGIEQKAKEAK